MIFLIVMVDVYTSKETEPVLRSYDDYTTVNKLTY